MDKKNDYVTHVTGLPIEDASGKSLGTYCGPLRPGDKIVIELPVDYTKVVDGNEVLCTSYGIKVISAMLPRFRAKLVRDMAITSKDWVVNGHIIKAKDVPVDLEPCEIQDVIGSNIFDLMPESEIRETISQMRVLEADEAEEKYDDPDEATGLISLGTTGRYIEL